MLDRSLRAGGLLLVSLNRRDMLRLGAMGAAGAILSSAASSSVLPSLVLPATPDPLAPLAPRPQFVTPSAPAGIDPQLFAKAKAALDSHRIWPRDTIGLVDFSKPSNEPRFFVVDLASGNVES